MKNLAPHRKFLGPASIEGSMRPFYQHPWPADLPTQCPICGNGFRTGWNMEVDRGRVGNLLKNVSVYSAVPCVISAFPLTILFGSGWVFFAAIFAPLLLLFVSLLLPIRRRVQCRKCEWTKEYPPVKPTPIPPAESYR